MFKEKSMFESSEIDLFDRKPSQHRWCSGTIAAFQTADIGSIHVRCINSDGRYKSICFQGKIELYYCVR